MFGGKHNDEVFLSRGEGCILAKIFEVDFREGCMSKVFCATWMFGTNSAFAVVKRKAMADIGRVGLSQNLPYAY